MLHWHVYDPREPGRRHTFRLSVSARAYRRDHGLRTHVTQCVNPSCMTRIPVTVSRPAVAKIGA